MMRLIDYLDGNFHLSMFEERTLIFILLICENNEILSKKQPIFYILIQYICKSGEVFTIFA